MITQNTALFTIFGATGDLAHRKLYPSLFRLYKKGFIKDNFAVIGTARREWSDVHFREVVLDSIKDLIEDKEDAISFAAHFYYIAHNVNDAEHYIKLKDLSESLDAKYSLSGNRIFYLAMSPEFFGTISEKPEVTYARRVQPSDHRETFRAGFRICGCIEHEVAQVV